MTDLPPEISPEKSIAAPSYDDLVAALIVAKCARWTLGTCITKNNPDEERCAVCVTLDSLGYEPFEVSSGGLESWRRTDASA